MELARSTRKTLTFLALRAGLFAAKRSKNGAFVESFRRAFLIFLHAALPLRYRLATNMKQAGVYRKKLIGEYYERAADQLCMIGHVLHAGLAASGSLDRFRFDASFDHIDQAARLGKGVIHIAPHICGYPSYASIVSSRIPCCVYMRRNQDPRKLRINEAVAAAGAGEIVMPPPEATKAQRLQVAISVLRQGKMLFVTPDTPRKPDDGVPVRIFGKTAYFPTGVFVMSARTGAPVVPVFWHWDNGAYHIRYAEPMEIKRGGAIAHKTELATKHWAQQVDQHLHEHPDIWWNWLDKRWTSILRNRYN